MADQFEPSNLTYREVLLEAVQKASGADAKYVESVPVHEVFQGKTVWEGNVEVFDLINCSKAKRAYAWSFKGGDGYPYVVTTTVILGVPPVDSPLKAVQASILSAIKGRKP
jgi:hypothetical protein